MWVWIFTWKVKDIKIILTKLLVVNLWIVEVGKNFWFFFTSYFWLIISQWGCTSFVTEKSLNTPSTLKFFRFLKHSILFHIFKLLSMISFCLKHYLSRQLCLPIHLASFDSSVIFSWKPALIPFSCTELSLSVTLQSWVRGQAFLCIPKHPILL